MLKKFLSLSKKMNSISLNMNHINYKAENIKEILESDVSYLIPEKKINKISIAPMMDITNVHYRFLMRQLTRCTTLWTEMYHHNAILFNVNGSEFYMRYNQLEHPVTVQFGGCDPEALAKCAKIALDMGYDEINLNCGCPSPKVTKGSFGACLMKEPEIVASCIKAMKEAVEYKIPVHVKCRIGVDEFDDYDFLKRFVTEIYDKSGNTHWHVHSRKAFLKG